MDNRKRVAIVGGVAGGASAAARARRLSEDAEITIFERGEHISFANCGLPYHIGGAIADRSRLLVQTPEGMHQGYRINVRTRTEAVRIDRERKEVVVRDLETGQEHSEAYDDLVLSPGAEPVRPPIPGVDSPRVFTLRNLADMDRIQRAIEALSPVPRLACPAVSPAPARSGKPTVAPERDKAEGAVVVGGGYIGLEMAEAFRERGLAVTLVELENQVMGPADPEMAAPLHQELAEHGVDLRLGTSVTGFREEGGRLLVQLSTGESVACGLAILAVGVRPESKLAREAGLTTSPRGAIVVDEHLRTSDPHIYAVGDAIEAIHFVNGKPACIPLAGPASRQGRIAADNIFGRPSVYGKTQGTAICKVFGQTIAMTGMSEKALVREGTPYEKVYVHPASHASYYPGAAPLSLKLLFDPAHGKILGAQAVGAKGVDKRIDVLAVAIRAGMTVYDLEELELAYAPPYGSAKDPVNYAGFAAANALRGDVRLCHVPDVLAPRDNQAILDVRTPEELATGTIPGAVHIPLHELRGRLGELPRDKELLVFCQVGLRGYVACRILAHHGFSCRNLTGGFKTFLATTGASRLPAKEKKEMITDTGADERVGSAGFSPSHVGSAGFSPSHVGSAGFSPSPRNEERPEGRTPDGEWPVRVVDATGLQCPGPILRLKTELAALATGQALAIDASDPAFSNDVSAWCHSTGHELLGVQRWNGTVRATIRKREANAVPRSACPTVPCAQAADDTAGQASRGTLAKGTTMVVFSGDFDRAMASFIIANGAASMGSPVTMFFTFWGLNVLRKPGAVKVKKTVVERMFGWMMPRGAGKLKLSKMHMGGLGTAMIQGIMRKKHVASLPELVESAKKAGVRLVACSMSMDLMGIKKEELIDGVEEGGVAMYLDKAGAGNVNLFI